MFRSFRLPWLGVALVLVLVAGALGGVAIAQIDGGDEYTGCLNEGGSINKVAIGDEPLRPCPDDQTEISWNQTGPPGPPGPSGLSQAFGTNNFGSPALLAPGSGPVDVATLDLPPGDYVLNTYITIAHEAAFLGGFVGCRFVQDTGTVVVLPFGAALPPSVFSDEWARGQVYPDHPGGGIVARCEHSAGSGDGAFLLFIQFNALAVDEVFIQH